MNKFLRAIIGSSLPTDEEIRTVETQMQTVEQTNQEPDDFQEDILASLVFAVKHDGDVNVYCNWNKEDPLTSRVYGELLYHVQSGNFASMVRDTLMKYGEQDIPKAEFIKHILKAWSVHKKTVENAPLIQPSQALDLRSPFESLGEE